MASSGSQAAKVNVTNRSSAEFEVDTVHAGFKFYNTGVLKRITSTGGETAINDEWMTGGVDPLVDAATFYVERTIHTGSLDTDEIGSARVQMNTTRKLEIVVNRFQQSCNVTVDFFNVSSGGTAVASATYYIIASSEDDF